MTTIRLGRTASLALLGLLGLAVAGAVDAVALFWCLTNPDTLGQHVSACLTTGQVIIGALATVAAGGALAHGGRHWGAAEPSALPDQEEDL